MTKIEDRFLKPLNLQAKLGSESEFIVLGEFQYLTKKNHLITVEDGFITNFASIPRWAMFCIGPPTGKYGAIAVIHDWLYEKHYIEMEVDVEGNPRTVHIPVSRYRADRIMLEGSALLGVPWWKRQIIYRAVRFGGSKNWG